MKEAIKINVKTNFCHMSNSVSSENSLIEQSSRVIASLLV